MRVRNHVYVEFFEKRVCLPVSSLRCGLGSGAKCLQDEWNMHLTCVFFLHPLNDYEDI